MNSLITHLHSLARRLYPYYKDLERMSIVAGIVFYGGVGIYLYIQPKTRYLAPYALIPLALHLGVSLLYGWIIKKLVVGKSPSSRATTRGLK
ncbi:MAG: hypothetical protein WAQ24_03830 [Candidatus Saccharimonadales bacterium]